MTTDAMYQRILNADDGWTLNVLADEITRVHLGPADQLRLQAAFAHRCRELYPSQCAKGRR